jgi:hydrogenase expression/formation protein HypD
LKLRPKYASFDATERFDFNSLPVVEPKECRSGEVLSGQIKPTDCECFGTRCTPESPMGAPMVSTEGACSAYYQYGAAETTASTEGAKS